MFWLFVIVHLYLTHSNSIYFTFIEHIIITYRVDTQYRYLCQYVAMSLINVTVSNVYKI